MHRSAQHEGIPVSTAAPRPTHADAARQSGYDGGPQRLSPWFGLTGLLLLATLLAAAFVQARQYTLLNMTVQYQDDYLVLSLQQMETEYLRLREQLRRDTSPTDSAALQLRYDVFVSRVSLLGSDRARRLLASSTDNPTTMRDVDRFIRQADLYLSAEPRVPLSPQAASALLQALEALDSPIHQLMLDASHRVAAQVTERQAQVRNHNQIGLALTGFLVAMVVLFAVITLRQLRALELRRNRLSRLADELRDARIDAESASDAKSEFLADMSHELRTPLHGLLGMLSLIKDAPRDPRAADWLLTADESAQHLRRLLDDILDLSKLDAGSLTLAPTAVAPMDLLREVRSLLQPTAVAKGLSLQVELDPLLPPLVLLDGTRVRQVLFNLVTNAIKYSEAGVVTLQCQRLAPGGNGVAPGGSGIAPGGNGVAPGGQGPAMIEFSVSDTGIGMDRDTVARLFRRHNRAEDVRAWRESGTGLGLAISRNLARLMGGEIHVRSMLEAGSVFSFHCPLHPVTEAPSPTRTVPASAGMAAGLSTQPARPLQVLVAEDHPVNRLYLAALLARLGHQVKLVDNGLEAVRAMQAGPGTHPHGAPAQAAPFDLVLMDVHMPVMDGVMATQAIRQLPGPAGQVCVVAITADVFDDTRARCVEAGVLEVVTKPLSLDALRDLLVRLFGVAAGMPSSPQPLAAEPGTDSTNSADRSVQNHGLLDRNTVHNVCDLMGTDKAPSLYGGFFTQAEDAARRMRVAMRDADPEALRRSAHTVKGAALNLGLPALADAASLLSREAGTLAAAQLALAVQRFEEVTQATRALCAGEGLVR